MFKKIYIIENVDNPHYWKKKFYYIDTKTVS